MKKYYLFLQFILLAIIAINPLDAPAGEKISVAVAANYIKPFKEIAAQFEKKTGITIEATFTSSGKIYGQIKNGAPYDLFLSADEERPALLLKEGLAEAPFIYARGQVILWSAHKNLCSCPDWIQCIKKGQVKKISIANPLTAPYGTAAMKALENTGIAELLKSKIVTAQDIAQSFQYASTEAVDVSFCALSAAYTEEGKKGCYFIVKEAPEIIQSACVLKEAKNKKTAEKFAAFLLSDEARKIREKYGYR